MDSNCSCDRVVLSIDHRDRARGPFRSGVHDVHLVACGADGDGDGVLAYLQFAVQPHIHHVEDGNGPAAAVGYVGKFAIVCGVLREVVRTAGAQAKRENAKRAKPGRPDRLQQHPTPQGRDQARPAFGCNHALTPRVLQCGCREPGCAQPQEQSAQSRPSWLQTEPDR